MAAIHGQWAIPVWPGTTLLLAEEGVERETPPVVLGSRGEELDASLWRVRVEPGAARWTGVEARWRATRATRDNAPGEAGDLVLLAIEIPPTFAEDEIVVGGRRVRVSASPALIDASWVSPVPVFADFGPLLAAARADEANPMLRWRARLLRAGVPDDPSIVPFDLDDDVLEALAVQEELRWRAGLSRLHVANAELAGKVRERLLSRVENAESGLVVPLWHQDTRDLEQLKSILLDTGVSGSGLATRVQGWLSRQGDGVAWYESVFAHAVPGTRVGFVRAWAGNTSDRSVMAWLEFQGEAAAGMMAPEPRVLRPGELAMLEAPVGRVDGGEAMDVEVHVGARVERGEAVAGAAAVRPPGFRLGPLVPSLDAAGLVSGQMPADPGACVGLLRRLDAIGAAPSAIAARSRWSVLLDFAGDDPGRITMEFAHTGGRTRVTVEGDGRLVVETPAGLPRSGYPEVAAVVRAGGRWSAEVAVPDWCVGADDRLYVSLLRRGAGERLWSWPTRVLNMAPERGGHAVVDLAAWDDAVRAGVDEPG